MMPRPSSPGSASVIIPALNAETTLGDQLDALAKQASPGVPWEVIVADNGSEDRTRDVARAFADSFRSFRVVEAASRRGASHARNRGAAEATGDVLCFCDADDIVSERWLASHVAALSSHSIAAGPLEVDRLNDQRVRRWRPTPQTAVGKPPAPFAPSGNMSIWKDVFDRLGGFDEDYLKSHDVEFSERARAAGFEIGYVEDAWIHYRYRESLSSLAHQSYRAGRATVQMWLDHPHAVQPPNWRQDLRRTFAALLRTPLLLLPTSRGAAVRILATQAGRLHAMFQYRRRIRRLS